MKKLGIPTKLRDFLKYCGCNVDNYTKDDRKKKDVILKDLARKIEVKSKTVADLTGTSMILRERSFTQQENFDKDDDDDPRGSCNKDTEGLVTMNCYSRGHQVFVTGGGMIRFWGPLFRSESPTQVTIYIVKYLGLVVVVIESAMWGLIYLLYGRP